MGKTATTWAPASFALVLEGAQAGEPAAYEQLWRTLAPTVVGYLRMQGAEDPDDLTSEVFLGAFRGVGGFAGDDAQFRSWLLTIAHRRLVDQRRCRQRRVSTVAVDEIADELGGDAEDDAMLLLASERVHTLLQALTPPQRDVLLLRFIGGLSVQETGEVLDRPVSAVKALSRRGLGAVRRNWVKAVSE